MTIASPQLKQWREGSLSYSPSSLRNAPLRIPIAPSVTMKGVRRREVMRTPMRRPAKAATASPPIAAANAEPSSRRSRAMTTVVRATVEPTDKSIPPTMMTIVIPKAATLEHVRENAAAADLVLDDEDIQALDAAFPAGWRYTLAMI